MISVIVPVFNGECYIDNLVKLLTAQSETDMEAIFIDDGSTDGTAQKLDSLVGHVPFRMVVKHQQNRGVSAARNEGLALAQGEAICFVDADDSIAADYLLQLRNTMQETGCRVVMGYITRKLEDLSTQLPWSIQVMDHESFCREFLYCGNRYSICAAMFDAGVFREYDLRFRENYRYSEDVHLLWRLFANEDKIAVLKKPIYYYNNNPSSAMGKVDTGRMDAIRLMESLEPCIREHVPAFGDEFTKYAVARHHWSILWQAAYYYKSYRDFTDFYRHFEMRKNLMNLFDYPDRLISISSRIFKISPWVYYVIIRIYLKIKRRK